MLMGQYNSINSAEKPRYELDQKFHLCQWSTDNMSSYKNIHIISTKKWVVYESYICESVA